MAFLNLARDKISADLSTDPELLGELLSGSLAKVYRQLGHFQETESVLREARAIFSTLYPGDHVETAEVLHNLGAIRYRRGDYDGAAGHYREAFEMRRRLGVPEAELIGSLSNLAAILAREGRFPAAAERYRQILDIHRRLFGSDDPRSVIHHRNLGMCYFFQSELERAERQLRRAVAIETAARGPTTAAAETRSSLARVLHARGDLEQAEAQLTEALEVQQSRLASGHEDLARSRRNLAAVLLDAGELATAEVLLDHAQQSLRSVRPDGDWELAELDGLIGVYLAESRDFETAESCLLDSHAALAARRGAEVIHTRQALDRLIRLYERWGKPRRAADHRATLRASQPAPRE